MGELRHLDQYLRMNHAKSFAEWRDALRMQALASVNFVYADRRGNIAYFYNAKFPKRVAGLDWRDVLPGDRSELIWRDTLPFGSAPHVVNPRSGFVVNALLIPYLMSAIRMVESGFATAEVVDRGMVLGCSHPMGPLSLLDHIGLDTIASVAAIMHAELNEPQYAPPPLLLQMVESGLLGRKSGQGFYTY